MRTDRATKVLLAMIAAGLWAIAMTQIGLPKAQAGTAQIEQERQRKWGTAPATQHTPTSTRPLRYRIPYARHVNASAAGDPDCMTGVSVVNFGPAETWVDVEFFDYEGNSVGRGTSHDALLPGDPEVIVTNNDVPNNPIVSDVRVGTVGFDGYALVNSDDPRIIVTAMMRCGDNNSHLPTIITTIPAIPVGATIEYFQAGMPAAWTPPMAEVPE